MDRIRKALDLARQERGQFLRLRAGGAAPAGAEATDAPARRDRVHQDPHVLPAGRPARVPTGSLHTPASRARIRQPRRFACCARRSLQRLDENAWRSLALMSPGSEDGKTTTAINLAVSLANDERHTVLLVDFDLKKPMIAKKLGIEAEAGTDDILRGTARVEDCLFYPEGFTRLVVLPAVAPMAHSSEALTGPRCRELVAELRSRYPERILLFDLPPILSADDALAFVPLVECVLMASPRAQRTGGFVARDGAVAQGAGHRDGPQRATRVASAYG